MHAVQHDRAALGMHHVSFGISQVNLALRCVAGRVVTAHAMQGDEQKAKEAGCDDYDVKPVELPRLLGKMEALLNRPPAA